MLTNIKKSKRRRYIRYPIELEATLIINQSSTPCLLLDFCCGGFFLGIKQSNIEIPLHQNITIRFSIGPEPNREEFEIDAQAVHITPGGVGVVVDNMPVSAFNALSNEANACSKTIVYDRRSSTPNKLNQENCKIALKQMLIEKLPPLLGQFFDALGKNLERANEQFGYFANSSLLDDLVTTILLNRESFVSEFCSSVISQLDYIVETNPKKEDFIAANYPLSLIEKEEFEDWLYLSSIIRKLNHHFEDSCRQLTREFARVFGPSSSGVNNPLSPAVLFNSFRENVLQFEFSNPINSILYHGFEKILFNGLIPLYEQTGMLLLRHEPAEKITPYSPYQAVKAAAKPAPGSVKADFEKVAPIDNNRQDILLEDFKPLLPFQPPERKAIQPISQITGKLLDILNEINTAYPRFVNSSLPKDEGGSSGQNHGCYSSGDLVKAISQMQTTIAGNGKLHQDATALNQQLRNTLDSSSQGAKALSEKDSQRLEIYGKFFETLFNEFNFSTDIKAYLEKIHLPLLSQSLQGNDFLDAELHPVRSILNQLAVLESAVNSNKVVRNINIKKSLNALIDRIVAEAGANPAIFAEVEQELNEITKQVAKSADLNIKRIVEAHEGRQKLEIAKRTVRQEIDQRLAGKPLPEIIRQILNSGWEQLLVIAELNDGKRHDEKQKYLAVIDDLIFWLYEQESIRKIQSGSIHKIIDVIDENLRPVCTDATQRRKIIEELTALLLGSGPHKAVKRLETNGGATEASANVTLEDNWTLLVEQLQVGEWLTMPSGSAGIEPMKLVWIGDVMQVYVFVNRDGLNSLELGKSELASLFRSGAAQKMESLDTPLMDRATNSMLQKMHEKLIHNATHDPVTNLYTRDEFVRQLKHEMAKLGNSAHMLCHVEVLDFRVITNICGAVGNEQLLKRLASLMAEQLRGYDLFARLGEQSFAILFKHCTAEEGYEKSKKLMKHIGDSHFQWEEKSFAIGLSMGLVPFGDSFDVQQLLQQADSASISAESASQTRIVLFTSEDENLKRQNKLYEWIGHIDSVLAENRLFVRCQMIAPIEQERNDHRHYEILLGVRDEDGSIVPPDHFIPAVERCKRMPEIDRWIIGNVFLWIEKNRDFFDAMDGFAINLSGQSINSEAFLEFLKETLESSNFPVAKLTFEITETVASENLVFTKRFIKTIKQFGCKFSLDDFGSGYSSYSYLKNLNVDYLKIDGAFVKDIANNKADIAIVKSMNEIAHSLGLKTIAEYVENNEIRQILIGIGVDYGQGYHIQKPIPLNDLVMHTPPPEPPAPAYLFEDNSFWDL